MDVILNTESLSPPLTGIGHYTQHLLRILLDHPEIGEVRRFAGPTDVAADAAKPLVAKPLKQLLRGLPGTYPLRTWLWDQQFRKRFGADRHAVYHEPNYILKPYDGPCVATVHDLSHIRFPQFHPRERVAYLERYLERTIARADRLITLSEYMRQALIAHFSIEPARITAIHLGADERYRPRTAAETRPVLEAFGLEHGRYILSVATIEPRKNLIRLLHAYARLSPALRQRYPLVLAGATGWRSSAFAAEAERLAGSNQVRLLGYVPADALPHLYAGAALFPLVSLYEGFGLPAVEAMASGVPLLSSTLSALPEVVGAAALYADPENVEEITLGIERLLKDDALRTGLVAAGLVRAAGYQWQTCVDRTVEIYRLARAAY